MEYTIVRDEDYLEHHGIKGQKWGIRRFQNEDGTLTEAGRERYTSGDGLREKKNNRDTIKTIATGVAIAGTAAAATYAVLNSPKAREYVVNVGKKAVEGLGKTAERVGKAMTDAMIASMGAIAVSKLNEKLSIGDDASEAEKNRNKIILDTATAGINAATNANSNSSGKSGNANLDKKISEAVGTPSKKGVDKSSKEWQALFKDADGNQRSEDAKSIIRSMASAGYDIGQIQTYLKKMDAGQLSHGAIYIMTRRTSEGDCTWIM